MLVGEEYVDANGLAQADRSALIPHLSHVDEAVTHGVSLSNAEKRPESGDVSSREPK